MQVSEGERSASSGTALLYRVAAVAALVAVATTVFQVVAFALWPPPDFTPAPQAVTRIFQDAHASPVLTFVRLDGLMLVDYVAIVLVFVALFVALRDESLSLAAIGATLGLVAATLYFTANPAPSLLVLAREWSSAPDPARAAIVGAGVGVLAGFQGAAFLVHYVMMGVAGIAISAAMLNGRVFSRATGVFGLIQGAMMLVPSTFGTVGLAMALASLLPFVVWFSLVAVRLARLARPGLVRSPARRSPPPARRQASRPPGCARVGPSDSRTAVLGPSGPQRERPSPLRYDARGSAPPPPASAHN